MLNPFTTFPRLISVYICCQRYNKNIPQFEKLRAAGDIEGEKALIHKGQREFIESVSPKLGLTYEISGEENIPETGTFMVYGNHQSFADILATLWLFRNRCGMGFVAKDEWRKVKPLANAISYSRSIFLIRHNPREAVKAVNEAKEILDLGFNMTVYPEGTRSQSHEMAPFKPGAFKFAEKAKVPILPVTFDGGYKLFEEKGSYQPAHIRIVVHPLVHIEQMDRQQQKQAQADIEATIRSAL